MFATTLALPVRILPTEALSACGEGISALVTLTPEKSARILRLMRKFTELAVGWVGAYQISAFDSSAMFLYSRSLKEHPPPNDFLVMEMTPAPLIHAGVAQPTLHVLPGAVMWSAPDADDRFIVTTIELDEQVVLRIARGLPLTAGMTGTQLNRDVFSTAPLFIKHPDWMRRLN